MRESLYDELRQLLITVCTVPLLPKEIDIDTPLIGADSPLGLDSLDAVEIVVAVQKKYGVRIGGKVAGTRAMQSLKSLAEYIEKHCP